MLKPSQKIEAMQKPKGSWSLGETVMTSAGSVTAGSAGDGPDLVLAHGWPWSSFSWHRVIPALAETYRVHWYDMPGYGQSDMRPEKATALDVQGSVFAEVLAHLLHCCDFEKYALMNVVAMRPWGSDFFDHVGRHVEAFTGLPPHIHKAVVEAYIRSALVNEIDRKGFSKLVEPWLDEDGRGSFYRQFSQADERFTADVEPMFNQIRCPVTILWGADDPWIPIERGKALHERIPQASFQSLPGVGHMPQLEAPSQIIEAIAGFLRDDIAT
ncbi:MAG: alpha/beta hydrolase [Paracoccaceae bacterium]|nr:alpha/beta hydrolase [Paracoccaceae bacterium]